MDEDPLFSAKLDVIKELDMYSCTRSIENEWGPFILRQTGWDQSM